MTRRIKSKTKYHYRWSCHIIPNPEAPTTFTLLRTTNANTVEIPAGTHTHTHTLDTPLFTHTMIHKINQLQVSTWQKHRKHRFSRRNTQNYSLIRRTNLLLLLSQTLKLTRRYSHINSSLRTSFLAEISSYILHIYPEKCRLLLFLQKYRFIHKHIQENSNILSHTELRCTYSRGNTNLYIFSQKHIL